MKFKIDENLPIEIADLLRASGHDADTVHDEGLIDSLDTGVIAACRNENRCLITLDLDFSDMRAYPPADLSGLIILRLRRQDKAHVVEIVTRMVPLLENEPLEKRLWIVDEERVRIRGGDWIRAANAFSDQLLPLQNIDQQCHYLGHPLSALCVLPLCSP